jgi:ribokinase
MILVAGSANLDFVVRVPKIPSPGETVLGPDFECFPGGKGANQAVACARAGGAATEMLLATGDDWLAEPIESALTAAGVRTHLVKVPNRRTGAAFISVSTEGENAIAVAQGANGELQADHLPSLDDCSHLLLQLEIPVPAITAYAKAAKESGVTVVLNAAPAQKLPGELLALVDLLIVNEGELTAVLGQPGSVASQLKSVDVGCVIVTLGERGCCAKVGEEFITQPGFSVAVQDTTAAGDTFCGTFVAALGRHAGFARALLEANAAGALACTRLGAQSSIPASAEVESFLQGGPLPRPGEEDNIRQYCGL